VAGEAREMYAVFALRKTEFEESLVGFLRLRGVFGHPFIGARIDAALRTAVIHRELAVLADDVRREDMLIVELPHLTERKNGRLAVPLPTVRFEPSRESRIVGCLGSCQQPERNHHG